MGTESGAGQEIMSALVAQLKQLPEAEFDALRKKVLSVPEAPKWAPNPGPQTSALLSPADELFYGGQAGGGKTDLAVGLAAEYHQRSLILRRFNDDARDVADRFLDVMGTREGFNGQLLRFRDARRQVDFGGCKDEADKQRYKGRARDLMVFDEIADFLKSQYKFIIAWNRSADPNQRVRVLCTGNPPTTEEGLWVLEYWGAWLDENHPSYPTPDGVLRWYTTVGEVDVEVDGPGPHQIEGEDEPVYARSRTFIRATLDDNPDLTQTNVYKANLAALPQKERDAYRDGKFSAVLRDNPWQVIPTPWIRAAQARWHERPVSGLPMSAIGVDVAQGGADNNVLQARYDGWFAMPEVISGKDTPAGTDVSGPIVALRKDGADITVDCGGGYGGSIVKTLEVENGIRVHAYKGAEASTARTEDGKLGFYNRRAELWWRLREALDPGHTWGSHIMLPPDRELAADLAAPTFDVVRGGIRLETAEKVKERLGRSPDKGMAAVLAWWKGPKGVAYLYLSGEHALRGGEEQGIVSRRRGRPTVVTSSRPARTARPRR